MSFTQHYIPTPDTPCVGARAILNRDGSINLMADRVEDHGKLGACKIIRRLMQQNLRVIEKEIRRLYDTGDIDPRRANPVCVYRDDLIVVVDTRGSQGYLYVTSYLDPNTGK